MEKGIRAAIDYLKEVYPLDMVPDMLYKKAGITGLVSSLSHGLRRAERRGEVTVIYHSANSGQDVAFYRANPGYKAPKKAKKATWYFYTIKGSVIPSGLFPSLENLKMALNNNHCQVKIWAGSYSRPILIDTIYP